MATEYTPELPISEGGLPPNPFVDLVRNPDGSWTIKGLPSAGGGAPGGVPGPGSEAPTTPPLGGVKPEGGPEAPGGGGGDGMPDWLKKFLTPQMLTALAAAAAGATNRPGDLSDDPNAKALLAMALKRQERTDPLHEQVTRLAGAMMPTSYQPGQK